MTRLERVAQALAIRPMLWTKLNEYQRLILRGRFNNQSYAALGETIIRSNSTTLIKRSEEWTVRQVLHLEKVAIQLDRMGMGWRWDKNGKS